MAHAENHLQRNDRDDDAGRRRHAWKDRQGRAGEKPKSNEQRAVTAVAPGA